MSAICNMSKCILLILVQWRKVQFGIAVFCFLNSLKRSNTREFDLNHRFKVAWNGQCPKRNVAKLHAPPLFGDLMEKCGKQNKSRSKRWLESNALAAQSPAPSVRAELWTSDLRSPTCDRIKTLSSDIGILRRKVEREVANLSTLWFVRYVHVGHLRAAFRAK